MKNFKIIAFALLAFMFLSCKEKDDRLPPHKIKLFMSEYAEDYVKLVLKLGKHDPDYVDAFFGPEYLKREAAQDSLSPAEIAAEAQIIIDKLKELKPQYFKGALKKRYRHLLKMTESLKARAEQVGGKKFTFDEESLALYNVTLPEVSFEEMDEILAELDFILPGEGSLSERYLKFRDRFVISQNRIDRVFKAAVEESRRRTNFHINLPQNESFEIEYVKNKPWGGYNWYKGMGRSLIQINVELPVYIDRAIDLACHEGYPGHHVYHSLLDLYLARDSGWVEFSIYPLFSPQALISEGTANFGIKVCFPKNERIKFEKEKLFPLAQLDSSKAEKYYQILDMVSKLGAAADEAARQYMDGKATRDETVATLMKYRLWSKPRAERYVDFIDKYGAYVLNYRLGEEMVEKYVVAKGGVADSADKRWKIFVDLITQPVLPEDLIITEADVEKLETEESSAFEGDESKTFAGDSTAADSTRPRKDDANDVKDAIMEQKILNPILK